MQSLEKNEFYMSKERLDAFIKRNFEHICEEIDEVEEAKAMAWLDEYLMANRKEV